MEKPFTKGIAAGLDYPIPMHLQPCCKPYPTAVQGKFPVTEKLVDRILSLPLFPELTEEQQDRVVERIKEFLKS